MSSKEYFSVREVAITLGFSPITVHSWIREGKLPAIKIGKAYRIYQDDLLAWRQQLEAQPRKSISGEELGLELQALFQEWLLQLANGTRPCSPATISTHRAHFLKFMKLLLEARPNQPLSYHDALNERALAAVLVRIPVKSFASRYNTYSAVMNFTRFLVDQGILESSVRDAMKKLKPKRLIPPHKTVLHTAEELDQFLTAILLSGKNTRYEKLLNLALTGAMAFAGLRVSEVANLAVQNVDFENRLIHVQQAKGGHPRMVGMNDRLKRQLLDYLSARPASNHPQLFLSSAGAPLNRQLIRGRISRIAKRARMTISPHGLRRTFATLNANAGRSLNLIQLALGHRDISTTQEYLMADNRQAAMQMRDW